ncbi:MAG: bifunctional aldolase/short-chain dehydrogenase [Betaproteobacteria bacterium]|nr:MAG: bifunctional aldolase/short-chain dehydrogenase [Betaproteobacteria bacterium]TMH92437.1 MAG: bifunctional aldolase/short-chain dehydrogenase [Betaproteobacteria bacterium]
MKSLWSDREAEQFRGDLGLRVYTSRLLGRDKSLVLHGGGNTSVKIREKTLFGEEETILYVKGSGWDLETIEPQGFSPVLLAHVLRLAELPSLSDPEMVNQLVTHMLKAAAPAPSIETILHGLMPQKFVDHTHADAVLSVTNTRDGEKRIREIYGKRCVVIPYLIPGFDLAQFCAKEFRARGTKDTVGMVLLNHGIFSFGETARESYERMIELVTLAEEYLDSKRAWSVSTNHFTAGTADANAQATLRRRLSDTAGAPLILKTAISERTLGFAQHPEIARISQQGPATPDHVIRTKRTPMLGTDVDRYVAEYRRYFGEHAPKAKEPKTMLDPAPRVVLDPAFGLATAGRTAKDTVIVEEIYDHTIDVILRAEALGGFQALAPKDIFDVEYWDLEQAKLKKGGKPQAFSGEVALVTGAASGIGKAAVEAFLARGAAVAGLDVDPRIESLHARPDFVGLRCDVTDDKQVELAIGRAVMAFGGIDMLVLNAGIFTASRKIADLPTEEWRKAMAVNLDANLLLMRICHPFLKLAPHGGRVVVIGSKNVPAPGPGASAYSASKAALNQLARIAALEWGADGIRINTVHPNAVFDTGLWTEEVLLQRAKNYGMTVEEYKTNNVLKTQVGSRDVAELAAEMCGPLFAKTTGAQVPVDGGNERVI